MDYPKKLSAIAASAALVFSGAFTGLTPAMAAPINPAPAPASVIDIASLGWSADNDKAEGWRSYRGYRNYRGYRGYGRGYRRHRDRIDAGDIIAGALIIGGIAAIASAASKNARSNDSDYRNDRRYDDRRYDDRSYNDRRYDDRDLSAMDMAVNVCSDAAERQAGDNARVSEKYNRLRVTVTDGASKAI
ncbi:hypothetical protein [Parasphingorhabdus sp.]|uniref:hypothetical protein n=1 Tax=Parasphingorhabdus sp. TaxID=2709688 RepID=UPI002F94D79A